MKINTQHNSLSTFVPHPEPAEHELFLFVQKTYTARRRARSQFGTYLNPSQSTGHS